MPRPFALALAGLWLFVFATVLALSIHAHAQDMPRCGKPLDVLAKLFGEYHESIVAAGQIDEKSGLIVTAAPDGSTWTALVLGHDVACVTATGKSWTKVEGRK